MSHQDLEEISIERFFEQLTWERVEKRVREALRYPDRAIPTKISCPAVLDLAKQVVGEIGKSAIQRPGEVVSTAEGFSLDQRVALMRILEAIIAEYEEWRERKGKLPLGQFVGGKFISLPDLTHRKKPG